MRMLTMTAENPDPTQPGFDFLATSTLALHNIYGLPTCLCEGQLKFVAEGFEQKGWNVKLTVLND